MRNKVLDNRGEVHTWVAEAEAEVSSHGPSGIGFVQRLEIGGRVSTGGVGVWAFESFGPESKLRIDAGVRTTGNGADARHTAAGRVSEQDLAAISTHTLSGRDHVLVEE